MEDFLTWLSGNWVTVSFSIVFMVFLVIPEAVSFVKNGFVEKPVPKLPEVGDMFVHERTLRIVGDIYKIKNENAFMYRCFDVGNRNKYIMLHSDLFKQNGDNSISFWNPEDKVATLPDLPKNRAEKQ
jgi:hypothetical protein